MSTQERREHRGLTRLLVRWFVAVYYPRIEVADGDRISQTGPVLLCGNHGNSLIDPVVIGIAARRPVRFMAKAPLFDHPVVGPPMTALGMIPAFRGSDDAKQVRRNLESLDVGAKVLVDGSAMGIFPEGKSTDQAHLEMIRSGAARMALQAVEEGAKSVTVVPLGLTYERKDRFRSSVLVRVGRPIDVDALLQEHDGNERKARRALTTELEVRLKEVMVHLDEPEWEPWLEDLETLVPPPSTMQQTPARLLWQRKRIADAMNYFLEKDRTRAESIADEIAAYREQVHEAGLRVDSAILCSSNLAVLLQSMAHAIWLVLLFIPALYGTVYHFVPFFIVRAIASRMDQPGRLTVSTHRLLVGVPLYLVWYFVVTLAVLYGFPQFAFVSLVVAPLAGLIAIYYWRLARQTIALIYHRFRLIVGGTRLKRCREQLRLLRGRLTEMSDEYAEIAPRSDQ